MKKHILFDCDVHGLIKPKIINMEKLDKRLIIYTACPLCFKQEEEKNESKPVSKQTRLDDLWLASREFKR